MEKEDFSSLEKEETVQISPQLFQQRGYNSLQAISGTILEECNRDLIFPQSVTTYKRMFQDATIAPALAIMEMSIANVPWRVVAPVGYKDKLKDKVKFLESVMNDMDVTWQEIIRRASTHNKYGFATLEKVFRRRTRSNGSKFDDGLVGIRDMPLIPQDSIAGWNWEDSGRVLKSLNQTINIPSNYGGVDSTSKTNDTVEIGRHKFLLFRTGADKDNPQGVSPLNSVYVAWRFKIELEKQEARGVANDLRGFPVIHIPARYLDSKASDAEKETCNYFKEIIKGMQSGEQRGALLPQVLDERGNKLFEFELKSIMGQNAHDIDAIISRYKKDIITGILAPHLILGQEGGGSFSLSESLKEITSLVVTTRLKEIRDQMNHDLIPQLFKANGWDTTILPRFEFTEFDDEDIDNLSKAIQRIASQGGIVFDAETVNFIHEKLKLPTPFEDTDISIEDVREMTTDVTSRSGDGMAAGGLDGTSTGGGTRDNSLSNMENV